MRLTGNLPGWPLLLDEKGAAALLSASVPDFRAAVKAGSVPPARMLPGVGLRWHRAEIEACAARIWGLDRIASADQDAAASARKALDEFTPPATRRAPAVRPGDRRG